ncbi:MAG: hypothetical protein KC415_09215 [Anaerolineales bacterium]|nr:hypothetical protein [Anaerolineales bacterium]MCB8992142.1 hypothetical protein [Ardenticatenaceae bacterium]
MRTYVAKPYIASSPQAELMGITGQALFKNLHAEDMIELKETYGFEEFIGDQWYSQQMALDFLKDLTIPDKFSTTQNLVALGMSAAALSSQLFSAALMNSIETFLEVLPSLYSLLQRNVPDEEGYWPKKISEGHWIVTNNTPYPGELVFGLHWAWMNSLRKPHDIFAVRPISPDEDGLYQLEIKWGDTPEAVR